MQVWQGRERLFYALTALPLRSCCVHGVLSTTLPCLFYDHGTSMPRWRRSQYTLYTFCRCLPRPCTFVVGSHCVFVTSRDLSINTKFNFSDTNFCFNRYTVNVNSAQNSELLLPLCLLQGQQALLDENVTLLVVRGLRIWKRRRRSCWVRHWLSEVRRLQFGHYDWLLAKN